FHDGHEEMIRAAWELLNEASLVVTFNGVPFDLPHLYREFALLGMAPPSPHKDVDLLTTVRTRFTFGSNKLANVVEGLGVGSEMETGGFELWKGCMDNDPKAWAKMKRYNTTDVKVTERLYDRLRPWLIGHPNLAMFSEDAWGCPHCGNEDISTVRASPCIFTAETRIFPRTGKATITPMCSAISNSSARNAEHGLEEIRNCSRPLKHDTRSRQKDTFMISCTGQTNRP